MPRVPSDIFEVVRREEIAPSKSRLELKLVTGLSTVTIASEPGIALAVARGVPSSSPAAPRDTDLDIVFDCEGYDRYGDPRQGIGIALAVASGGIPFVIITATATALAVAYGSPVWGSVYPTGVATALAKAYGDLLLEGIRRNFVKWSNIGSSDFTVWKDNIAGEEVLDWKGWVYAVKKLGNKVVAYGENGVTVLIPNANVFTPQTVYRIGLKGKQAIAGNEAVHFFIDTDGQLFMFGETAAKASLFESASYPQKLDYSEYLSVMTNPVLSWDELNNLLYICDGTYGYVYSPQSKSLGKGPINVTGMSSQSGVLYVAAPATIVIPTFEKWTDIYDMGSRKGKSIVSLEYGIDLTKTLKAAIRYRLNKASAFSQTNWYSVDSRGLCFIQCYGQEFQFGAKTDVWESFELDYMKVNGAIYDH